MEEWKVSLHGGHSGEYCDHAEGTLREMLDAAVAFGYQSFGVSEHVPRWGDQYLYDKEKEWGWTVEKLVADFYRYGNALRPLAADYADRLTILCGFEAEVVPPASYVRLMQSYRERRLPDNTPCFDYMVGSVHFIHDVSIDGPQELFAQALEACGGLAELLVTYYQQVAIMVETLRPEVVGHFDLIKLNLLRHASEAGYDLNVLEQPAVRDAATRALEAVRAHDCILDLNTAGWRKGLGEPYPGSFYVTQAHNMGIPFCFGDDSHHVAQVGAGIQEGRDYLLRLGVDSITILTKEARAANSPIVRRVVSLG